LSAPARIGYSSLQNIRTLHIHLHDEPDFFTWDETLSSLRDLGRPCFPGLVEISIVPHGLFEMRSAAVNLENASKYTDCIIQLLIRKWSTLELLAIPQEVFNSLLPHLHHPDTNPDGVTFPSLQEL
jgi:hypothetical protein